jgi:hypothetical protein
VSRAKAPAAKILPPHEVAYSLALAEAICERFADGASLREIGVDPAMPGKRTILRWLGLHAEFRELYELAYAQRADTDAEQVGEIVRDVLSGAVGPAEARVAVDALKWAAGARAPKKYGPKMDLNHGGAIAVGDVDRPPRETREEWLERRRIEMGAAAGAADRGDQR